MKLMAGNISQFKWLRWLWIVALATALVFSGLSAARQLRQVPEFPYGCDPFGYLQMAQEVRRAATSGALPQFALESGHTRLLIDLMQSSHVQPLLWTQMIAPHAHHYFPQAGRVGVQYPPGTALTLALFREGTAVRDLNRALIWLLVVVGLALLVLAGARGAWIAAGFTTLVMQMGMEILMSIQDLSFSINAMLAPLLVSCLCLFAALRVRAREEKISLVRLWSFLSGLAFGLAVLDRLPVILLAPGFLLLAWRGSWSAFIKESASLFCVGLCLSGIFPLMLHQQRLTGAWFLSTYDAYDSTAPSLAVLPHNVSFYISATPGGEFNWWLLVVVAGFACFAFASRQHAAAAMMPFTQSFNTSRLALGTLLLWSFPTAYFLTHEVLTIYYLLPSTFAAALFLALGVLNLETRAAAAPASPRELLPHSKANHYWRSLALVLALVPGGFALERAWSLSHLPSPQASALRHYTLPAEVADERAWVWADMFTGTLWYYDQKPAYKISFSNPATRALVFRFVFDRGEPQYVIRDSPNMQKMIDEITGLGGTLEQRGEIDDQPYYLIHWPSTGPATEDTSQIFKPAAWLEKQAASFIS